MNVKKGVLLIGILIVLGMMIWNFKKDRIINLSFDERRLVQETKITHGHGLAVDVQDSNVLYIATHHGLLILKNEKDLYRVGKSKDDYMGFSPHPTEANILFSSGHPSFGGNIGFQKSEDGGFTWKKISNGFNGPVDFHAMAISPVNPNLIYGWYQGTIQRSIDQGKTWEIVNRDVLAVHLAADSQDENMLYAATPDGRGVLISRDKGGTWSNLSKQLEGGQVSVVAVHPFNSQEILVFSEKLGGLGKSLNGGKTWKKISEEFFGSTVLYITYDKNKPQIVYLLTHKNAVYKSIDSGETWRRVY